jgi:hypothetical protein
MIIETRRRFLLSAAALSVACTEREPVLSASNPGATSIRQPSVGESWRYAKHDLVTRAMVDTEVGRESFVGQPSKLPRIPKLDETSPSCIHRGACVGLNNTGITTGPRPPCRAKTVPAGNGAGRSVLGRSAVYEKSIPPWPVQLRPGWGTTVATRYMIPGSQGTMPWQLTMHVQRWESIVMFPSGSVVSGRIWFAREVGRWVVKESSDAFYHDVAEEFNESSFRGELLSWG